MTEELRNKLLDAFPGKMENEEAFIMQFVMMEAAKGTSPPPRDQIQEQINAMISEGIFEKKGGLLILKTTRNVPQIVENDDLEEENDSSPIFNPLEYSKSHQQILMAFQGKYENKNALIMSIIMKEIQEGNSPPSKDDLEKSINEMLNKNILEEKGNMLIKKV